MISKLHISTRYFISLALLLCTANLAQSQNNELLKAAFLLEQGRYTDVLKIIDPLEYSSQESTYYFDILGEAAFQTGDYDKSLKAYLRRIELENPGQAHYQLARIYFINKQSVLGYKALRAHLNTDNRLFIQQILADEAFDHKESDREWIRFWSEGWYSEKDDLIAEANFQLKEDIPDTGTFDQLRLLFPDEPQSWFLSGRFFELTGKPRQVNANISKAIELDPECVEFINYHAVYYAASKKYRESSSMIEKSLAINPYQPSLWMLRISNHLDMGNSQVAMREMRYLEMIGIESPDLWTALAMQVRNTNIQSAIKLLDRVIRQSPLSKTALNYRADLYWENMSYDSAMKDWAMSLDVDPKQAEIYYVRGEARHQLGNLSGACHDWRKALRYGHRKALDMLYKYCD
ncbi:MAG: tetratricopeptide repeat protein [Bacteroidales bacterium]|nr:tetratricopeptide repeat protein [Bacteroidales bacterium]